MDENHRLGVVLNRTCIGTESLVVLWMAKHHENTKTFLCEHGLDQGELFVLFFPSTNFEGIVDILDTDSTRSVTTISRLSLPV